MLCATSSRNPQSAIRNLQSEISNPKSAILGGTMNAIITRLTKATSLRIKAGLRSRATGLLAHYAASCLRTTGNTARSDI